tara:strand:- start:496 stop:1746 length:1251 start_codon:yes stop_codon:yes gene_type:complete
MSQKTLYLFDQKKVRGVFHKYKTESGASKRPVLCSVDEVKYRDYPICKRKRCRCKPVCDDYSICPSTFTYLDKLYSQQENRYLADKDKLVKVKVESKKILSSEISHYLNDVKLYRSYGTYEHYKPNVKRLLDYTGNIPLDRLTTFHKGKYQSHLTENLPNLKPETIGETVSLAIRFFNWLYENDIIDKPIQVKGKLKPWTKNKPPQYTEDLIHELLEFLDYKIKHGHIDSRGRHFKSDKHKINYINYKRAIMMARYTAMRSAEIWALPLNRINVLNDKGIKVIEIKDTPELNFKPKSHESREVPMHPELEKFLKDEDQRNVAEYWYYDKGHGAHWSSFRGYCSNRIGLILNEMGRGDTFKNVRPLHAIRAYCITKMLDQGIHVKKVQKIVGHKFVETTMRYCDDEALGIDGAISVL